MSTASPTSWLKTVNALEAHHSDGFRDLLTLAACVCSCGAREDEYRRTARKYTAGESSHLCGAFSNMPEIKLGDPFTDLFSTPYMERLSPRARSRMSEVYTPPGIGLLMARMVMRPPELGETLKGAESSQSSNTLA